MGDRVTGGTIYKLGSGCDKGDILLQRLLFVNPEWDYHELWKHLFPLGVEMTLEAVRVIASGKAEWIEQDESVATWEPSWERPRLKRNELMQLE